MFSVEEKHRLSAFFEQLESSRFTGAVAVCAGADDVITRTFGRLNSASETSIASTTFFDICSVTKTFTAAAVRTLETGGRIALDRCVGEFLEALPDEIATIRIHQLLDHSSGLADFIDLDGAPCEYSLEKDYAPLSRDAFLGSIRRCRLLFPSGRQWSYSNAGYSLLAAMIELVTGEGFETYLRRELLLPLGIHDTQYALPTSQQHRAAAGRLDTGDWRRPTPADADPSWNAVGNGGLLSTISDLVRWQRVFCSPRWPGIEDRPAAQRVFVDRRRNIWSGGGRFFHEADYVDGGLVYHNGGNSVFSATLRWLPRHDRYLAVISSCAAVTAMSIARTICELWRVLPRRDCSAIPVT